MIKKFLRWFCPLPSIIIPAVLYDKYHLISFWSFIAISCILTCLLEFIRWKYFSAPKSEIVRNILFKKDTETIIQHSLGKECNIQSVRVYPAGTNSGGSAVSFTTNKDGTISIELNCEDKVFDVYIFL